MVVVDADGAVAGCTAGAAAILGLTCAELLGQMPRDPRWTAISEHGLPLQQVDHPAARTLVDATPVHDAILGVHVPRGSMDGSITQSENRWLSVTTTPVEDASDDPAGVLGVCVSLSDVTDSPRGHAATMRLLEAYRLLVQYSPEVMIQSGPNGLIDWVSATVTPTFGWTPDQLIGRGMPEFIHPDDLEAMRIRHREIIGEGSSGGRVEFRFASADGTWRWVSDAGRALYGALGEIIGGIDTLRDIQDEVEAREALARSEQQYRLLAENSTDVVYRTEGTTIAWVSPSVTDALGWTQQEVVGQPSDTFSHPDEEEAIQADRARIMAGNNVRSTVRIRASDGSFHWARLSAGPSRRDDGTIEGVVASFRISDAEVQAEREMARRAMIDDLTGTLKRAPMLNRLLEVRERPRRPGVETAVLFADIDDFKSINDRWGHATGDAVLEAVAARMIGTLRASDAVARMGGDEFLALLDGIHDLDEATAVAEKIRIACAQPIETTHGQFQVTLSIGVTLVAPSDTGDESVNRADRAMYAAKEQGRNRVVSASAR